MKNSQLYMFILGLFTLAWHQANQTAAVALKTISAAEKAENDARADLLLKAFPLELRQIIKGYYFRPLSYLPILHSLSMLQGHKSAIVFVAIEKNGTIITRSVRHDKPIIAWNPDGTQDTVTWKDEQVYEKLNSQTVGIDGTIVVGFSGTTNATIYPPNDLPQIKLEGHDEVVLATAIDGDELVVTGSADKTVRIWNMDGTLQTLLRGNNGSVRDVCLGNDGTLAVGGIDKILRVWRPQITTLNELLDLPLELLTQIKPLLQQMQVSRLTQRAGALKLTDEQSKVIAQLPESAQKNLQAFFKYQ